MENNEMIHNPARRTKIGVNNNEITTNLIGTLEYFLLLSSNFQLGTLRRFFAHKIRKTFNLSETFCAEHFY